MVIELRGVEFHNKGAELMLHAILQKIKQEIPNADFVMERRVSVPKDKMRANSIFVKLNHKRFNISLDKVAQFVPKTIRRKYGYILPKEINVVLDGSGFAFGDQWGAKKAGDRLADHIVQWKKQGKKIIMLPQALGPFTDSALIVKMVTIIENADQIFARDKVSFDYIKELVPGAKNITLMPDFTNLIAGTVPNYFDKSVHEVAIIPNNKMLETTSEQDGHAYVNLLQSTVETVQRLGFKPFFLIHEGEKDLYLANQTNEKLASKIQVITEDDPLKVKGIIGQSKAVITSRFHGLVSSLAQSVPCLATGWSHKYEMLLKDYKYQEALLDVNCSGSELENKVNMILKEDSRSKIVAILNNEAKIQKKLTSDMWNKVIHLIKAR